MKATIAIGLWLLLTAFVFSGCAGRSTELLAEDYRAMNDQQLLEYFYRLNDEIERQEKPSGPTFGVGIGSFGRGVGGGVGLNTGETAYTADDLRKRRIEIRLEPCTEEISLPKEGDFASGVRRFMPVKRRLH